VSQIRCAIYTRKSSEEGLDQSFNSLDAQREACESYIRSQRHEGWQLISTRYDDGGFSGGNMDRPALKRLMVDIEAGKVNTVVVYKVDRLTRSLADFAKIIEKFDAMQVSFVSVTQQFNTTTSMGRLTLNVLLSFAQFEREVTGERIRDKIAASKAKGMWMGGPVPVGYDLKERKLHVNQDEAAQVNEIFSQYLRLRTVPLLMAHLKQVGILTKVRLSQSGTQSGGSVYSRGALYQILRNHLYIGEIKHKDKIHRGEHDAIIDRNLWDRVQVLLDQNRQGEHKRVRAETGSLLTGRLFSESGVRYIPTSAQKSGRRYRYYTSQSVINGNPAENSIPRLPAHKIERVMVERIRSFLQSPADLLSALKQAESSDLDCALLLKRAKSRCVRLTAKDKSDDAGLVSPLVHRVIVHEDSLEIQIRLASIIELLLEKPAKSKAKVEDTTTFSLSASFRHVAHGKALKLIVDGEQPDQISQHAIVKAIARARSWYDLIVQGEVSGLAEIARNQGFTPRYAKKIFPLALLSPESIEHLLSDHASHGWTLDSLRAQISLDWKQQKATIWHE
jgi:site-specific DNA recombinase